jgi:hypothetical protein
MNNIRADAFKNKQNIKVNFLLTPGKKDEPNRQFRAAEGFRM